MEKQGCQWKQYVNAILAHNNYFCYRSFTEIKDINYDES